MFAFVMGPQDEHNYRTHFFDEAERTLYWTDDMSGNSSAIRDGAGEFTDITLGRDGEQFYVQAGDTELFRITPKAGFTSALARVQEVWLVAHTVGDTQQFDWVEVTGTPIGGDATGPPGFRRTELLKAPFEAFRFGPIASDNGEKDK